MLALGPNTQAIEEALAPVRRTARPRVSAKHGADRSSRASPEASSSSGVTGDPPTSDLVNEPVLEVVHAITTDSSLDYPKYVPADVGKFKSA